MQLTRFFCWALVAVSLANGATAYLKRVGVLDHAAYREYVSIYCEPPALPCSCMRDPTGANDHSDDTKESVNASLPSRRYVYEVHGYERVLKPLKDGLFAAFFAVSLALIGMGRTTRPAVARLIPLAPLALSIAVGLLIALGTWGMTMAALGLRSFAFLGVALLGGWIANQLPNVSRALVGLLVAQFALVLVEFWIGIPLRYCDLGFRAAGTLVIANSLGVFAVVALAFCCAFATSRRVIVSALLCTLVLLWSSFSGTGIVCLIGLAAYYLYLRLNRKLRIGLVFASIVLVPLLVWKLPEISQRPQLYASVTGDEGRVGNLLKIVSQANPAQFVFGHGLGFGSNASITALKDAPTALPLMSTGEKFAADSTVTVLFIQLGVVGILCFYGLLIWAFLQDQRARPFYLVVGIGSLAIIVTELFPVNLLLGLALAHTLWHSPIDRQTRT